MNLSQSTHAYQDLRQLLVKYDFCSPSRSSRVTELSTYSHQCFPSVETGISQLDHLHAKWMQTQAITVGLCWRQKVVRCRLHVSISHMQECSCGKELIQARCSPDEEDPHVEKREKTHKRGADIFNVVFTLFERQAKCNNLQAFQVTLYSQRQNFDAGIIRS